MMRIDGRPVVKMSHAVAKLWVHAPNGVNLIVEEGQEARGLQAAVEGPKSTMQTAFFAKCADPETPEVIASEGYIPGPLANQLRYEDFPRYYRWDKSARVWVRRKRGVAAEDFISRLGSVNPRNAELTAIRILLQNTVGKVSSLCCWTTHILTPSFRPYVLERPQDSGGCAWESTSVLPGRS
jgi:hypothetical protein